TVEVQERPLPTLVPHILADRGVQQGVHRESLPPKVLRDGVAEVGERVTDRRLHGGTARVPGYDQHPPLEADAPGSPGRGQRGLPQILGDALASAVAGTDHEKSRLWMIGIFSATSHVLFWSVPALRHWRSNPAAAGSGTDRIWSTVFERA